MIELVVQKALPPVDWVGVPPRYVGKASAVCRSLADCQELVSFFGSAEFCPFLPVLVHAPQGWTAITGLGYATAAELQDCAVVLWHRQTQSPDWDEKRERAGLMRREDVPAAISEALTQRIARHKASPITDPFRQPRYPRINGKIVFPVNDTTEELKKRRDKGFTKPSVKYNQPGPATPETKEKK